MRQGEPGFPSPLRSNIDKIQVHPICGNCSKIAAACTYDDEPRENDIRASPGKLRTPIPDALEEDENRSKGNLFPPEQTPDLCAIETQLAKLTSLVEQLQEDRRALRRETVNSEPVAASTANGDSGPEQPSGAAVDGSSDEFAIPTGLATDPVDPLSGSNVGHLSHARRGSSRLVLSTCTVTIIPNCCLDMSAQPTGPISPTNWESSTNCSPVRTKLAISRQLVIPWQTLLEVRRARSCALESPRNFLALPHMLSLCDREPFPW